MINWSREIKEKGTYIAILDRIKFHGSLSVKLIQENTGLCYNTIMKHLQKMIDSGEIKLDYQDFYKYNSIRKTNDSN